MRQQLREVVVDTSVHEEVREAAKKALSMKRKASIDSQPDQSENESEADGS